MIGNVPAWIRLVLVLAGWVATGPALAQEANISTLGTSALGAGEFGAGEAWSVRLAQVEKDGKPAGAEATFRCPRLGCQQSLVLTVGKDRLSYVIDIVFVARGAYLSFGRKPGNTRALTEFGQSYQAPTFVPFGEGRAAQRTLRLNVDSGVLSQAGGEFSSAMRMVRRRSEPDAWLRFEARFLPPRG